MITFALKLLIFISSISIQENKKMRNNKVFPESKYESVQN